MSTYIYSYNPHSASAKALAEALGVKRIKHNNSKYRPKPDDVVINWGSSHLPDIIEIEAASGIINESPSVKFATNKLSFFEMINPELTVPWTTEQSQVQTWLSEGRTVVARTKLTGHSGEGIVLIEGVDAEVVEAPLYTLYMPKKHEYRVHCITSDDDELFVEVFDVQQKKRKLDVADADVNWKIRNLNGGFIYSREDITVPDCVITCAKRVFGVTNLDFGAVDIIYNENQNKAYALEVNTAPGLTGTTLEKYAEAIGGLI